MLAILFIFDSYVLAQPDKIVINPFWGLGENHYSYSDVRSIRTSMRLEESDWDQPIYVIDFSNGDRWSSRWDDGDRPPHVLKNLIDYISKRSGIPIDQVPALYNSDV